MRRAPILAVVLALALVSGCDQVASSGGSGGGSSASSGSTGAGSHSGGGGGPTKKVCSNDQGSEGKGTQEGGWESYPDSVLHLCVSGTLTDGSEATITATGSNADQGELGLGPFGFALYWVDHDALPIDCATVETDELTIWGNNGDHSGQIVQRGEQLTAQGPFSYTTYVPVNGPGHIQLCGYVVQLTDTAAWASVVIDVT